MRTARMTAGLLALVVAGTALAQEGQRRERQQRQRLDPEQAQVARTWQAKGTARDLGLGTGQTEQLVETYVQWRGTVAEVLAESRKAREGEGGDRRERLRIGQELLEEQRENLQQQLADFLPAGKTEKVMATFGSFNAQWDRMVAALATMELGDDLMYDAMTPVREYIVVMGALRGLDDRDAMRTGMREARASMNDALGEVLSEDQMAAFRKATDSGRRGGRQRGGGEGQRQRRGDGDRAAGPSIGEPAPAFSLTDASGREHSLAEYQGRIVVLQWVNPDCPWCVGVTSGGKVAEMRETLAKAGRDVVYLAVNSTHYMEPAKSAEYFSRSKIDAPVLIDRDGKVGRLYNARTTPHMYVIDAEGVLRYEGAFSNDQRGEKGAEAVNYVVNAVRMMAVGETVAPDKTRSWGCSVKYAP